MPERVLDWRVREIGSVGELDRVTVVDSGGETPESDG
jgi:hypothetical protein